MSRAQKRISLIFINNDANLHNAYKRMMDSSTDLSIHENASTNKKSSSVLKCTYSHFKHTNNQMKFPFGLSEQRFQWQNNDNKHRTANSMDLTGNLNKKKFIKSSFDGGFESFLYDNDNKNETNSSAIKISTVRKIQENKNSNRVMNPKLDVN
jgi:hypothetical protein